MLENNTFEKIRILVFPPKKNKFESFKRKFENEEFIRMIFVEWFVSMKLTEISEVPFSIAKLQPFSENKISLFYVLR